MSNPATKSGWTERRLNRLFARYNLRYWRGRLPVVPIRICKLDEACGHCDWKRREIAIDLSACASDRQIRDTLLHEMAHLAAGPKARHDSPFFSQVEHLLRQKAPLTVSFSETDYSTRILGGVVPRRFPLARRLMNRAENRRARMVLKQARECGVKPEQFRTVGKREMVQRFADAAMELAWREALFLVGNEYGLLDVDGKPKNRRCADLVAEGRRAHTRQRREFLSWPENSEAARQQFFEAGVK